jgi:hypothetical protein
MFLNMYATTNVLEKPVASIFKVEFYHLQAYGIISQEPTILIFTALKFSNFKITTCFICGQ